MSDCQEREVRGHAGREVDLRGERCPYTFIKARLAIEEMAEGEILAVVLDFVPAFARVPASMEVIGHRFLGQEEVDAAAKRLWFEKGREVHV